MSLLFNLHSLYSCTIKIIYVIINNHNKQQKLRICNCTVCLAGEWALENWTTPAAFSTAKLLSAALAEIQSLCNNPVRDFLNARTHISSHGGVNSWVCYIPCATDLVFSLPKPGVQPIADPTWARGLSRCDFAPPLPSAVRHSGIFLHFPLHQPDVALAAGFPVVLDHFCFI